MIFLYSDVNKFYQKTEYRKIFWYSRSNLMNFQRWIFNTGTTILTKTDWRNRRYRRVRKFNSSIEYYWQFLIVKRIRKITIGSIYSMRTRSENRWARLSNKPINHKNKDDRIINKKTKVRLRNLKLSNS